ncbi:MAG: sugar phosphate isomerase/epimerase family protein [Promethearchaeota archaeon]
MKIGFNTYSIRKEWNFILGGPEKKVEAVSKICKDAGIDQVEFLDRHFDPKDLKSHCKQFADNGITVFSIGPHVHLLVRENQVETAVKEGKFWLNLANDAGVKNVRFQVGDGPLPRAFRPMDDFDEEDWDEYNKNILNAVQLTGPVLSPLIDEAENLGVNIGIETHHSYSSNYIYMRELDKAYPSKNCGWIFDIGNYETDDMRWKALEVIKHNTKYIHAKAYDFDDKGFEKNLDYVKACKILHDAGFNSVWSIEFEGRMNGILGALRSNELIKYCISLVHGKEYSMKTTFPDPEDLMEKYFA